MTSQGGKPAYDLEERTAKFGQAVIESAKTGPRNDRTRSLRMIAKADAVVCEAIVPVWQVAKAIHLILAAILRK